jgi:hypothetical protein
MKGLAVPRDGDDPSPNGREFHRFDLGNVIGNAQATGDRQKPQKAVIWGEHLRESWVWVLPGFGVWGRFPCKIEMDLCPKLPKLAAFLDEAEADVLAYMTLPAQTPPNCTPERSTVRSTGAPRSSASFPMKRPSFRLVGAIPA